MWSRSTKTEGHALKGAAFAAALSMLAVTGHAPPAAAEGSPFTALAGSWSGGGSITLSSGTNERLRCRATYAVHEGGRNLQLSLRCASDSYNFNMTSNVRYDGGTISGSWSEATRNVSGDVTGRASGNQILVSTSAGPFAANFLLYTRGDKQSISMKAIGTEITGVSIGLSRGR